MGGGLPFCVIVSVARSFCLMNNMCVLDVGLGGGNKSLLTKRACFLSK